MPIDHSTHTRKDRKGVFISYARSDGEEFATKLRERLEAEKISLWQDRVGMEGGRDWWLQITEALDHVVFMALVVTPNALKSDIVRKEWRYARQQGVCVYPIKGSPGIDFNSLPRWMRDAHFYDLGAVENDLSGPEWKTFVNDLNKTPDARRVPFMVEDLPEDFVERPVEFDQLLNLLLDEKREEPVAITAALRGAGGYGKTTLAKALCHDLRIQDAFDDGILWVTLGENPGDLTRRVEDLIYTLNGERPGYMSVDAAAARLAELLADRDTLIVIDDVWNGAHLRPFVQGGSRCARLITTRIQNIAPTNVHKVEVDAMQIGEAIKLVAAGLEDDPDWQSLKDDLRELAKILGEWPLLLKLANGALRSRVANGESFCEALDFIKADLEENGLTAFDAENEEDRNHAVQITLSLSFKLLKDADLARFHELAVFPEDVNIPLATVEKLWANTGNLSRVNAQKLCERLYGLSLLLDLDLREKRIKLHDVIRKYLIEQNRDRLNDLHNHLLDAHRPAANWSELPENEPYLWDHLAFHLIEAERGDELVATVKDWRYLAKKTLLKKALSVENDLIKAEMIAPADDPLRTLRRNFVNTDHLFNHCETRNDIDATLFFRLRHLSDLKTMLQELANSLEAPHIAPKFDLPDLPHPALIRTLEGHSDSVNGCAFSPDGKQIVSASDDRTLKVWEAESGEMLRTLEGHSASVNGCAFSPDGKQIVSASEDCSLKIWDTQSGEILRTLEGHSDSVNGCAFSPDGKQIVSASDDRTLKVWETESGEMLRTLEGHSASVNCCAFSPDGKQIVSASEDSSLKVWDAKSGEMLQTLQGHSDWVRGCAFSPDGKQIVSASLDSSLKVWDTQSGEMLRTLEGHSYYLNDCASSPNGKQIVSASGDRTLKVWDTQTDGVPRMLIGHSNWVNGCAFSPDWKQIVSASDDNTLKVWEAESGEMLRTLEGHSDKVNGCAFSTDRKLIVSASWDRTLKVWDAETGEMLRTLEGHSDEVRGCAFSPVGKQIVSASLDCTLKVWDAESGEMLWTLEGHSGEVNGCAFSPDGKQIVSASEDSSLKIWDTQSGEMLRTLEGHSNWVRGCAFSPDGKQIVSASEDSSLKVWDTKSGNCLVTFYADGPMLCCTIHEDMIVAGGTRGLYFLKLVQ